MENNDFLRRAEDLSERGARTSSVTMTGFLTPAESYELKHWAEKRADCKLYLTGGSDLCERQIGFFLPEYMESEWFDASEYIKAIHIKAHFGEPSHRDYMGALLGMGIGREWLGDIWVSGSEAYIFCQPSVLRHLLSIEKVGRCGVTASEIALDDIPKPERNIKEKAFSVMSMRLDAVCGGMFDFSRTESAKQIKLGNVNVNYSVCDKTDMIIKEGDIISLRGAGKGSIKGTGGTSRKGRLFVYAEILK